MKRIAFYRIGTLFDARHGLRLMLLRMPRFKAIALRWVSDDPQPGVIEISVHDAFGRDHRIIEKDIVTEFALGKDAHFPVGFWIEAEPQEQSGELVTITLPWSMSTTEGETQLTMSRALLRP